MHLMSARSALPACACAILLAACGGGPSSPGGFEPTVQSTQIKNDKSTGSWMAPEAAHDDLLYVSDARGVVDVFSFPAGKRVGVLKGLQSPAGMCSSPSGNIFVANFGGSNIIEYAHGGTTSIAQLNDFGHYPYGCSFDPATGNLAVANYSGIVTNAAGSVAIFLGAKGIPHSYQDPAFVTYYFCGYDDKSNLFVDGANNGTSQTLFAELPKGKTTFTDITLNEKIGFPGAVQWDGRYIDVGDSFHQNLYRFAISGKNGKAMGKLLFGGDHSTLSAQFWLQGSTVVLPYGTQRRSVHNFGVWPYPKGGAPSKSDAVAGSTELLGAAVSLAKN